MKSFLLLSSFGASALAGIIAQAPLDSIINNSKTDVPEIQTLESWNRKDAVVKKVRYGPFTLPAAPIINGEVKSKRISQMIPGATKPCESCTILMMLARLEYADGTEAKDPGTYMHHAAILNGGPTVTDGNCRNPGLELFFSSGNEKSTIIFTDPEAKYKSGYYIAKEDYFVMQTEILNNEPKDKQVWATFSFEILPGKQKDYQQTHTVWVSYNGTSCSGAGTPSIGEDAGNIPPPNDKAFALESGDWISPYNGNLIAMGGHMHDGGIRTEIYHNDKLICDSVATYAKGDHGGMRRRDVQAKREFLAKMSGCTMLGRIVKGDRLRMTAKYDFTEHDGLRKNDGSLMPIMAVATVFVAEDVE